MSIVSLWRRVKSFESTFLRKAEKNVFRNSSEGKAKYVLPFLKESKVILRYIFKEGRMECLNKFVRRFKRYFQKACKLVCITIFLIENLSNSFLLNCSITDKWEFYIAFYRNFNTFYSKKQLHMILFSQRKRVVKMRPRSRKALFNATLHYNTYLFRD